MGKLYASTPSRHNTYVLYVNRMMFDWDEVCQTRENMLRAEENWKHIFWYQILFTLLTCRHFFDFTIDFCPLLFYLSRDFGTSSSLKCWRETIWCRKYVPSDETYDADAVKHIWFFSCMSTVYKLIIIFVDIDLLYDVNHKKNGFICVTCSQFNDKFVSSIGKRRTVKTEGKQRERNEEQKIWRSSKLAEKSSTVLNWKIC